MWFRSIPAIVVLPLITVAIHPEAIIAMCKTYIYKADWYLQVLLLHQVIDILSLAETLALDLRQQQLSWESLKCQSLYQEMLRGHNFKSNSDHPTGMSAYHSSCIHLQWSLPCSSISAARHEWHIPHCLHMGQCQLPQWCHLPDRSGVPCSHHSATCDPPETSTMQS